MNNEILHGLAVGSVIMSAVFLYRMEGRSKRMESLLEAILDQLQRDRL